MITRKGTLKMKKLFTCLTAVLCSLLLLSGAFADSLTLSGTVIPADTVQVYAPIGGTVENVLAEAGQQIQAEDLLYTMKTAKVYADRDGTVTGIFGQPGDSADTVSERYGAVLYLEETAVFTVSASTDKAYSDVETKFVHAGETVYLVCRSNYTRTGTGIITAVSGKNYTVEVTEGTFIPGDSVDLFRDEAHTNTLKIGQGSVSRTDPVAVTASGAIVRIAVQDGAAVKRGDLLLETLDGTFDAYTMSGTEIKAGQTGIVASVSIQKGDSVQKDSVAAVIYPVSTMRVEAEVTEDSRNQLHVGDPVSIELEIDESRTYTGTIVLISALASENTEEEVSYRVVAEFTPDEAVCFGMSAVIVAGEDPEPAEQQTEEAPEEAEPAEEEPVESASEESKRPEKPEGFEGMSRPDGENGSRPERPEGGWPERPDSSESSESSGESAGSENP